MITTEKKSNSGFNLIELAIVGAIMGAAVLASAQLAFLVPDSPNGKHALLVRANNSLMGYVLANSRLPCPSASSVSGQEDCSTGSAGYLPYKTLGLPDPQAGAIRYGVWRQGSSNADLTQRTARLRHLTFNPDDGSQWTPLVNRSTIQADSTLDGEGRYMKEFCYAVRVASERPLDTNQVHLRSAENPNKADRNIAYVLALPSSGSTFDGVQKQNTLAFDSPARKRTSTYRDVVLANTFHTLWEQLACGPQIATVHQHAQLIVAAALHELALKEFARQLALRKRLAKVLVKNGEATVAGAYLSEVSATVTLWTAYRKKASALADAKATKKPIPLKEKTELDVAVVKATLGMMIASTNVFTASIGLFSESKPNAKRHEYNFDQVAGGTLIDTIDLKNRTSDRFIDALQAGLFLPPIAVESSTP